MEDILRAKYSEIILLLKQYHTLSHIARVTGHNIQTVAKIKTKLLESGEIIGPPIAKKPKVKSVVPEGFSKYF